MSTTALALLRTIVTRSSPPSSGRRRPAPVPKPEPQGLAPIDYVIKQDTDEGTWTSEVFSASDVQKVRQNVIAGFSLGRWRRAETLDGRLIFGMNAKGAVEEPTDVLRARARAEPEAPPSAPRSSRKPARGARTQARAEHVVPCDIVHVVAALRLVHETMPFDTWSEQARARLAQELGDSKARELVAQIRARLLTVDPEQHWLVEDRWLRAVQEEHGLGELRALVAARWYAEQAPVVRAAEHVRAMRERFFFGRLDPYVAPTTLGAEDLDGFFKPPLPVRDRPAQRRALTHALFDLGLVEEPDRQSTEVRITARSTAPIAAFGWALRYDLRRQHRVEASQRWVERESLPARLFGLSPSQIAESVIPRIWPWAEYSELAGQPRVIVPSDHAEGGPAPSSSTLSARIFAIADQAERQRFDVDELRDIVASFRDKLGPYFEAPRRRDPTPVFRAVRGYFPPGDQWPTNIDLRTDMLRHVADGLASLGEADRREQGGLLELGPAMGRALTIAAEGLQRSLDTLDKPLSLAIRNMPGDDLCRMAARLVEHLAAEPTLTTSIDWSDVVIWLQQHAIEIHAASPPIERLSLPNDALARMLRLAARAPIGDYRHRSADLAVQRLIVKAMPDRAVRAAGLAAELLRRRGLAAEGQRLLVVDLEGHRELADLPPPPEPGPLSSPRSRLHRFELVRDVGTNGGAQPVVAFVHARSRTAARAAFEAEGLGPSALRSIVDAGAPTTAAPEGRVVRVAG